MADWRKRKTKEEDLLDKLNEIFNLFGFSFNIENFDIIEARDVLQSIADDMDRIIGCCDGQH